MAAAVNRGGGVSGSLAAALWRRIVTVFSHVVDMNPTKTEVSPTNMHQTALNAMK